MLSIYKFHNLLLLKVQNGLSTVHLHSLIIYGFNQFTIASVIFFMLNKENIQTMCLSFNVFINSCI